MRMTGLLGGYCLQNVRVQLLRYANLLFVVECCMISIRSFRQANDCRDVCLRSWTVRGAIDLPMASTTSLKDIVPQ